MPGQKQLKNIAYGLLATFVSRNNNIYGYWGLGVLRSYVTKHHLEEISVNLLAQNPDSVPSSPVDMVARYYQKWLFEKLDSAGIDPTELKSAEISIRFSTYDEIPEVRRDTWGEPYKCLVTIATQKGITYSASKIGVCAKHNPLVEFRSTRI